jgi:nicotinamide-nucleotide adenylyltransferase
MATIIFPGNFEPFHNGHLMVVQGMVKLSEEVVVMICDSKNPTAPDEQHFTVEQRREMIGAALLAADILDATIAVVRDAEHDADWAHHVLDAAGNPAEPMVWSGDDQVRAIFEAQKIATKKIVPVPGIVGADIRKLMKTTRSSLAYQDSSRCHGCD